MLDWTIFWLAIAVIFVWISAVEIYKWFSKPKQPEPVNDSATDTAAQRLRDALDKFDAEHDDYRKGGPRNPEFTFDKWCPRCGDHEFRECADLKTGKEFRKCVHCGYYYGVFKDRPGPFPPGRVLKEGHEPPQPPKRQIGMVPELEAPYNCEGKTTNMYANIYDVPLHLLAPELAAKLDDEYINGTGDPNVEPKGLLCHGAQTWPEDKNTFKPNTSGDFPADPNLPK